MNFIHYTVFADGKVGELTDGFECPPGFAWMAMKVWANSVDESIDVVTSVGKEIGFTITGEIEVYITEPTQPASENPFAYDIGFTPYQIKD